MILRIAKRLTLLLFVLLATDQLVLFGWLRDGEFLGKRIAPFDPPVFSAAQRASLGRTRALANGETPKQGPPDVEFDAELGWAPAPGGGTGLFVYDDAGARSGPTPYPHPKPPGVRRIVAIGCSFTRGDEVEAPETWAALVDAADGLEVANLGVGAYGLDQALLRYRRDGVPLQPDEVWLTVLPAALARLINVYRPAMRHWDGSVGFKPRFVLDEQGQLELLPSPATSRAELMRLLGDQRAFLAATSHDPIIARVPAAYAPTDTRLVHRFAVGRLALTALEHRGTENWVLVRDPELRVPELARAVLQQLADDVARTSARLRIVVIPCQRDLELLRETGGEAYWKGIELGPDEGVDWIDLTDIFLAAGATDDAAFWRPGGHLSPRGNRLVAESLLALLEAR